MANTPNSPDIEVVVGIEHGPTFENFDKTLKDIIEKVEKGLPKIKFSFDTESLKKAVEGIEVISEAAKQFETTAKKVAQSTSSEVDEASEGVKTLAENETLLLKKYKQVDKLLDQLYDKQRKFSGAGTSAKKTYSIFGESITELEKLKKTMGDLTFPEFDNKFSSVEANLANAEKTLSRLDEKTKVLTASNGGLRDALRQVYDLQRQISKNAENWSAAENGTASKAYSNYVGLNGDGKGTTNDLINKLKSSKIAANDFALALGRLKSFASQYATEIQLAGEATKAAVGTELVAGTKEYEDALKKVDTTITTVHKNLENWTKAESGNSKESYENYKSLEVELDTVQKCIKTGQLTREEFLLWMSQIGSKAAKAAKEIKLAGEATKAATSETLTVGTEKYNKALNTVSNTLKQVEANTKKWTLAKEGNSKGTYEVYAKQAEALRQLSAELRAGGMSEDEFKEKLNGIISAMRTSEAVIRENGEATGKLSDKFSILDTALGKTAVRLATMYLGFQRIIQVAKQMIQNSIEIESAMNRLQIVTGASNSEMKRFFSETAEQAKELGKNIVDVAGSIETFSRLGYNLSESSTLSKFATIMANVANTDVGSATTGLTSIIKGYGLEVSEVEHVADVLINVGQKYAISAEELMQAFERGGAALNASGTSFEKSAALFAATNAALQNAANTGTMWKTVSARIRGSKAELDELGESMDDLVGGFSKYREEIKALSGVDIMIDDSHFKDIYDIFVELAGVWDKMEGDTARARVSEILGGTRQLSGIASTIQNISDAIGAFQTATTESAGVAIEANNKYMETTAAHIEQLKTSFQELSYDFFNSDLIKNGVDFFKGLVETIDWLTKRIGSLNTAILGFATVKSIIAIFKDFGSFRTYISMFSEIKSLGDFTSHLKTGFEGLAKAIGISSTALGTFLVVAGGITAIIMIVDALTDSYDELRDRYNKAKQSLENTESEISNVNSELKTTRDRLNELEGKHLSAVEQAEYNRLVKYNEQLKIQKKLLEETRATQKIAAAAAANKALTTKSFTPLQPTDLIGMIEAETNRINDMNAHDIDKTDSTYVDLIVSRSEHIKEAMEYASDLLDENGEVLPDYVETYDRLFTALENSKTDEQRAEEIATKKSNAIQNILSKFGNAYKAIQNILKTKPYGVSSVDITETGNQDLINAITTSGYTITEVAEEINAINGAVNEDELDKNIKQLFHLSGLVRGSGIGIEQAFAAFKGLSDSAQVAAYNSLKSGGIKFGSWTLPDFEHFFGQIAENLTGGRTYLERANDQFESVNDGLSELGVEVERYNNIITKVQEFDKGTGNSISPDSFYSEATIRSLREQIASLSQLNTDDAKKQIVELEKELSGQLDLKDLSVALEYNNGTLSYNLELVEKLVEAKRKEALANVATQKSLAQSSYLENADRISELRKQIENTTSADEKLTAQLEIEDLLLKNSELANDAQRYDILRNSIEEATDAYHDWINAQKATESGQMFSGAVDAINKIDEILNDSESSVYGKVGRTDYKAAINFIIPEEIDKEDADAVDKYIKSIGKYFTTDKDSNIKGLNLDTFLNDAVQAGLMIIDESGENYQIAGTRTMKEFADGLGLALPLVQAIFGELEEYGGEFSWADEAGKSLVDMRIEATEAAEALRKLGNLSDFDVAATTVSEIDRKIKEVQDFKAKPELDVTSIENANRIIEYLVTQKQVLQEPLIMSIDASDADAKYSELIQKLQEFHEQKNNLDMQIALDVDEATVNASKTTVDNLAQEIAGLNTKFSLGIDDTSADGIEEYIQSIQEEKLIEFGVDKKKVEDFEKSNIDNNNATVHWGNDLSAVNSFINAPLSKTAMVKWQSDTSGINNGVLPSWAKVSGTANAGGNWGNKRGGKTLVGELGQEIVVNPHTGRWYTVGDTGAEYIYLPRDAIVFNHKQSKSLLENGKTNGRGTSMAGGTAFVTGGIRKPNFSPSAEAKDTSTKESTAQTVQAVEAASNNVTAAAQTVVDNSNTTTQNVDDKTDTILENFRDWFSKLFDWVEVRISRLSDRIEKTVAKAERNLSKGRYNSAASNYTSAIGETLTLISNEQKATAKYSDQASSILQRAVANGIISQTQADDIRSRDRSGLIDISEYSERVSTVVNEYQNWMDKAREASSAIDELHDKINGYVQSLKEVRDAQRDARLRNITNGTTIGTGSNAGSYSYQNRQLAFSNSQLRKQNNAYSSAVKGSNRDLKKIGISALSGVNSQLKNGGDKKYIAALSDARSSIKSRKSISSSTLSTIKKNNAVLYSRLTAYNFALSNVATAREESALNYAASSAEIYGNISKVYENKDSRTNDRISLLNQKSGNATTAYSANKYLNKVASNYKAILKNDENEIGKFAKLRASNAKSIKTTGGITAKGKSENVRKNVAKVVNDAKASAKARKYISPTTLSKLASYYEKGYVAAKFYQSCIDYNNAHDGELQAKKAYEIDKETIKANLVELGSQRLTNVQNAYGLQQDTIAASKNTLTARQSLRSTKGISMTKADYTALRSSAHSQQVSLQNEQSALRKTIRTNLKSGYWSKQDEEYKKALNTLKELDAAILKAKEEQIEYNNAIAQLPFETIEKAISKYDALEKYLESVVTREQAKGNDLSAWHYTKRIDANVKMIEQYTKERAQALEYYGKALANKDGVYGGKTADEWLEMHRNFGVSVNNLIAENEKLADQLRDDVYWRSYERAHESAKRLQNVLSGISELLSDDMYFNKDGFLTQYGVTKIAELTKQYELAGKEVQNYSNDINNLNDLYERGEYTEQEYIEKLATLRDGLLDSAKGMKQYLDAIKDMYKTIAQEELDRLFKLIDARSEALDKKKAYYDYDKTIRDKTKDIRSLESQLAALSGVNTSEAKAQRARLQAQLSEANEDLAETQRDHEIELSKESLDGMKTTLQEEFDNKWDNLSQDLAAMKQLLEQANQLTSMSVSSIDNTLGTILSFYGVDSGLVGVDAFHASGAKRVKSSHIGLSMEKGNELLVTKYGIISKFNPGDGIIPSDLTERLYTLAQGIKPGSSVSKLYGIRQGANGIEVNQTYGSLINIEGSADAATVEDLKNMSKDLLERSYNYTSKRMTQDYARTGGRRVV